MLSQEGCYAFILPVCVVSIIYSMYCAWVVSKVEIKPKDSQELNARLKDENDDDPETHANKIRLMASIGDTIAKGANDFLMAEYFVMGGFMFLMAIVLFIAVDIVGNGGDVQFFTTLAFILGAITSVVSGYIGMKIAVYANSRTAYVAIDSLAEAFQVAFTSGCVMGFSLTGLGLLVLTIIIAIYRDLYGNIEDQPSDMNGMMECVAGYGLGGSTVALFGRVGGGIYTKAADVGADLVGKVENDLPEDSPKNPATIADNVGDNVGDIAGMGADLFGSFAESTCAALAIMSTSPDFYMVNDGAPLMYPLIISAFGIVGSLITSVFATHIMKVEQFDQIEKTLKYQIIISTVILTPLLYASAAITLPDKFTLPDAFVVNQREPYQAFICSACGLWSGFIIGYFTDYCTSNAYKPVQDLAHSCSTGAATNIIYGLALGYYSTVVPVLALGISSYISFKLCGTLGLALVAIGMLSNMGVGLAIDAYGPISDNAGGIAEMSDLGEKVRERTDALDAAGNTTAAIGKGFAIGSAALVSLALYGAFVTRSRNAPATSHRLASIEIMDALVFTGLLVGAMLPYLFSAMTMKSVGTAALEMVEEVRRQLRDEPRIKTGEVDPDYKACIQISTKSSLKEMIAPGMLVIITPLFVGFLFGPKAVAGLLPGALVSGVQMAISMSNTGGAWDNCKKYVEQGKLVVDGVVRKKGSDEHKAAVIGDTVGDPLKDTSGPALNILVKLMAILSLVFAQFFTKTAFLVCPLNDNASDLEC